MRCGYDQLINKPNQLVTEVKDGEDGSYHKNKIQNRKTKTWKVKTTKNEQKKKFKAIRCFLTKFNTNLVTLVA